MTSSTPNTPHPLDAMALPTAALSTDPPPPEEAPSITVAFLTDFGTQDGYSGTLHGVLLDQLPPHRRHQVQRVDLSHHIPPQDIASAQFVLSNSRPYFPPYSMFVVVVDPGVGSANQHSVAVAVPHWKQLFIAPDNGVLAPILDQAKTSHPQDNTPHPPWIAMALDPTTMGRTLPPSNENTIPGTAPLSQTFHGRDLYAPAAAKLATAWLEGPQTFIRCWEQNTSLNTLTPNKQLVPPFRQMDGSFTGAIQYIDQYGNAITNIPHLPELLNATGPIHIALNSEIYPLAVVQTYQEGASYQDAQGNPLPVLLPGSSGFMELACSGSSAKNHWKLQLHQPITLSFSKSAV